MKPSRWLILTQYYPPELGAPQIRLRSMAKELGRAGIKVDILTAMPNYPKGEIFEGYKKKWWMRDAIDGNTVRRVWIYPGTGKSPVIRLFNYLSFTATALIATLFGPRPDVLFVESQPLSLGIIALLMKWIRGVPYIYNVPDLQVEVAKQLGFIQNERFLRFAFRVEQVFLKQSWKVSTVTHCFLEHMKQRGLPSHQVTFLPNGADTEFLKPMPPCQQLLQRWNLEGKKVFLYVGTHAYYHGLDSVIHAAKLLEKEKDITFLMIGQGPERARLKILAKDLDLSNVVFGDSPFEERDRLYSISFASIATLRKMDVAQTMRPAKIFPSLSCGVPVIYSGTGETTDLISGNQCGLCVEPEDPQRLADAVKRLAADSSARTHMGEMGRKLVESEFSWNHIVQRWLNELECSPQD